MNHIFWTHFFGWRTSELFPVSAYEHSWAYVLWYGGTSIGTCPGVIYLGLQVELLLVFWETARLISRVVVQACNPTSNWRSVPLSPHPCQHLLSHEILILAILTSVRWNLRVLLISISLMIKDVEHFFRYFSAIQYSLVENSLFSSVPHFLIGLFSFLESNFYSSLYKLDISPLSDLGLVKIFSQSVGYLFVLLTVSFCLTEAFQFYEVPFVNSWS